MSDYIRLSKVLKAIRELHTKLYPENLQDFADMMNNMVETDITASQRTEWNLFNTYIGTFSYNEGVSEDDVIETVQLIDDGLLLCTESFIDYYVSLVFDNL